MFTVVSRCPETIMVIREQIYSDGAISSEGETETHPAIAGPKVQDPAASVLGNFLQHMLKQIVIAARPDEPLLAIVSRGVDIWKAEIEFFVLATSAFGGSYAFVVFYELCIVHGALRRYSMHNFTADFHSECAHGAIQSAYV